MGKQQLCRQGGLYQWDAQVAGVKSGMRQAVLITVFSDTRSDGIAAACAAVERMGYVHATVDHITKVRA